MNAPEKSRSPQRWAAALLLLAAGFVIGLAVTSGGSRPGEDSSNVLRTPAAIALPSPAVGSYADVAEALMPSIVNISTDKVVERDWQHPFFEDPWFRRFFNMPRDREFEEDQVQRSLGSGIVIGADGYILTNHHVVAKASKIRVIFQDKVEYEAEIVGSDEQTDVALIKIDPGESLTPVQFGDSDQLRIADEVMAIGNPFGLGHTVTKGIVSAVGRAIGLIDYEDLIQTDATINPGNSGGALVNMRGEVVGMSTAILSRSGGSQGIGFAIPSNMALQIMDSLREDGEVKRAWLGVNIQGVDHSLAEAYDLDKPRGVLVSNVVEDTPAEKAGLKEGDIILAVDGQEVNSVSRLRNKISLSPIGEKVNLRVLREGRERDIAVKLAEINQEQQIATRGGREEEDTEGIEGVTVRNLNDRRRQMAEIPGDLDGVIVVEVDGRSNAAREGLAQGDIIMEIGNERVVDIDDYQRLVQKAGEKPVLLRVFQPRSGGKVFLAIPR